MVKPSRRYNNCEYLHTHITGPKYIKQIRTETKSVNSNTVIVGKFNTPLSTVDQSSGQRINKNRFEQHHKPVDLTDTHRIVYQITAEYTFFLSLPGTSMMNHIIAHKHRFSQIKKILKSYQVLSLNSVIRS